MTRSASFSRDRRYRYRLTRSWQPERPPVVWVMLNPSAADGAVDDPTIRRVMGFSRAWGYGGCHVVNLFARCTHDPRALAAEPDPVGPGNHRAIGDALRRAPPGGDVVVGWGRVDVASVPVARHARAALARIRRAGLRPVALGRNADGSPRHPLYVRGDAAPVRFESA